MPKPLIQHRQSYHLKNLRWLLLALILFAADQFCKYLATTHLALNVPMPIWPMLNLTLAHNTGSAFSFLASAGKWRYLVFFGSAAIATVILLNWLLILRDKQIALAIGINFILAGAWGNCFDRIVHGYVIDFVQVYYGQWSWPIFNVADGLIDIGIILIIYLMLRKKI